MASAVSSTPVKWIASDHDGLPMKRKQVAQACETCRKRKKRCSHTEALVNGDGSAAAGSRPGSAEHARKPLPHGGFGRRLGSPLASGRHHAADEEDATQVAANRLMELSSSRFISDLNPEGMFIQAATPALPHSGTTYRDKNDLGVWLPPYSQSQDASHGDGASGDSSNADSRSGPQRRRHPGRSAISEAALMYERAKYAFVKECLTIYPPDEDFAVLHRIYCEKVHPLLPVLKDSDLRLDPPSSSPPTTTPSLASSIFPTVVKQIIALSAATTDGEAAAPHLRLEPKGPLLTPREFHHRLTDAASTILDADMIAHRFDYIRATILLSFFYQPSAEVDRNKPSLLSTQAAHHFQTIGAHLLGYRPEQPDDDVERIFCALWALDRLASVLYARPCMMHAYDNGKNAEECIAKQPPCFRLFMSVIFWLDKVIDLYRPRQPFVMIDIPVYEALILDAQAEKLPSIHLGTIEVLYHTVCVLSCRQPLSAFSEISPENRDDRTYLPISIMNPRRSHSSDRIVWVTQTQPICLFPFIPYSVSIALSVQYKKMRYSRTPLFRNRARVSFKDIVALLKSMGDVFINARVNAALGESIWKQMEKTVSSLAREELESSHQSSKAAPAVGIISGALASSAAANAHVQNQIMTPPAALEAPVVEAAPEPNGTSTSAGLEIGDGKAPEAVKSTPNTLQTAASSQDYSATSAIAPAMQQHPGTTALLDLSVLDTLDTDIDLFGNFDPNFDLGAIDTALEANLDMGIPQNWAPWNNLA